MTTLTPEQMIAECRTYLDHRIQDEIDGARPEISEREDELRALRGQLDRIESRLGGSPPMSSHERLQHGIALIDLAAIHATLTGETT